MRLEKIFYCLLFLLLSLTSFSQIINVEKINAAQHKIKKILFFHDKELEEEHFFNPKGQLTESYFQLSIYAKRFRTYNAKGLLVEDIEYDDNDSVLDRRTILYNSIDKPIVEVLYNAKDSVLHTDSTWYTKNGKEREYLRYNSKGNLKYGFIYKYDKQGVLVSKKEISRGRNLEFRTVYRYNPNGRLILETTYDARGKKEIQWETLYNQNGQEVKSICQGNCLNSGGWLYKYNDTNQVIEYIELDENGKVNKIFKYRYDEKGNKSGIVVSNWKDEIIESQTLKYNEHNLLVEKIKNDSEVYNVQYEFYK